MQASSGRRTIITAFILSIICSVVVSTASVMLRPLQERNEVIERRKNVLSAAGIYDPSVSVQKQFENIKPLMVNLETGEATQDPDLDFYYSNFNKLSSQDETSIEVTKQDGLPGISSVPKNVPVFIYQENGETKGIILPVYGNGLWSTMYGFLALKPDTSTIIGLTFYDQQETPGLGGEVDNPLWKQQWEGKELYGDDYNPKIAVVKPGATGIAQEHKIDAISGASLTSKGVQDLVRFWASDKAFGKFLKRVREGKEL